MLSCRTGGHEAMNAHGRSSEDGADRRVDPRRSAHDSAARSRREHGGAYTELAALESGAAMNYERWYCERNQGLYDPIRT